MRIYLVLSYLIFTLTNLNGQTETPICFDKDILNNKNIFSNYFENKSAVFLGETHGLDINYRLFLKLLKDLNEKGNFQVILLERNYSEAFLFNRYLTTGDETFLKYDHNWNLDMQYFFKELLIYNNSLPLNRKLQFLGIDAVHDINPFLLFVQTLIPKETKPPERVASFLDSIKNISLPINLHAQSKNDYVDRLDLKIKFFKDEIENNKSDYELYFGNDFKHVQYFLDSKSTFKEPANRNQEMYNNILYHFKYLPSDSKFIGLFGSNHLMHLNSIKQSMSYLLNNKENSPMLNNVSNIIIHYENSKAIWNGKEQIVPDVIKNLAGKKGNDFKQKLMTKSSCSDFLIKIDNNIKDIKTHCDFIIFISNAKPISSIKVD